MQERDVFDFTVGIAGRKAKHRARRISAGYQTGDSGHILSAQVWLKNMPRYFAGFNKAWVARLPEGHSPARAAVQAEMVRPDILVEVMIAAVTA
ncbi:hypothetical protein CD006_17825 [Enterobacter sp. 10-1]|nr:hypothetical protein [Raoultella sp. 10-1]PAC10549.1 hypothetical protein CD006_17825 [Enterobacter sp. 10-1]